MKIGEFEEVVHSSVVWVTKSQIYFSSPSFKGHHHLGHLASLLFVFVSTFPANLKQKLRMIWTRIWVSGGILIKKSEQLIQFHITGSHNLAQTQRHALIPSCGFFA